MDTVTLYTDGACSENPGVGGWACLILYKDEKIICKGSNPNTTNNQMELIAFIQGIEFVLRKYPDVKNITVFTDSQYLSKGINEWIHKWITNNWQNSDSKEIKNLNLWKKIYDFLKKLNITCNWTKGHHNDKYNNLVDKEARSMIEID